MTAERIAKIEQEGLKAVGGGIAWAGFWIGLGIALCAFAFLYYHDTYVTPEQPLPAPAPTEQALPKEPVQEVEIPGWDECIVPGIPFEGWPTPNINICNDVTQPHHIMMDSIGVDHPVFSVALEGDGTMEIPEDIFQLGWYELGVMPGEYGSAVIAGHVDSREQGEGALFDLRFAEVGDTITTLHHGGERREWVIQRTGEYNKYELPMEEIFFRGGDVKQLVLITCGGDFDREIRRYENNVVVYASMVSDS